MAETNNDKDQFLSPYHSYRGKATPQNIVFDANLQNFSQQVMYICALETGGKLTPHDAYERIKVLWKQLKASKQAIIDNPQFSETPELPED